MIPVLSSSSNIFLVSTVRQLVCGSSRNLNPMILGTDPFRVPNLRRELPLGFEGRCRETGKDEGPMRRRARAAQENFSSTISPSPLTKEL